MCFFKNLKKNDFYILINEDKIVLLFGFAIIFENFPN